MSPGADSPPAGTEAPALCASCAGIQRDWRRAPGHAELVQGASRKVERSDGDHGARTVTLTRYRCDACGASWNYENDRQNQRAGWSLAKSS